MSVGYFKNTADKCKKGATIAEYSCPVTLYTFYKNKPTETTRRVKFTNILNLFGQKKQFFEL